MPDLQKGLIGHWTMNSADISGGTLYDKSAYDNHGTVNGAAVESAGPVGGSMKFDGSSNQITLPELGISGDVSLSVSAWFKVDSDANDKNNIFGFGTAGTNDQTFSIRTSSDGSYRFYFWANDLDASVSNFFGSWTHVVATYDSDSSDRRIYHNGSLANSDNPSNPSFQNQSYQISGFNGEYFDGMISDVRLYNRALSQSEINQLYNFRGNSRKSQTTVVAGDSLQAWYPFLQSGAADKSGNGNDGTVNGATYNENGGPEGLGSYDFNGDYIEVPLSVDQDNTGQDYTVSAWFNSNDVTQNSQGIIGQDNGGYDFFIQLSRSSNGELMIATGSDTQIKSDGTINSNEWNNIVVLLKGSDILYSLNGEPIQDTGVDRSNYGGGQESILAIGSISYDSGEDFNGEISDVRVYNKALSNSEINQLYNPKSVNLDRGLVGHWSMDDSDVSGGTLYDRSAYDRNGDLRNGVTTGSSTVVGTHSFSFDGSDDYVRMPKEPYAFEENEKEFSFSCWIYPTALQTNSTNHSIQNCFAAHSSGGDNDNFEVGINASTNDIQVYIDCIGSDSTNASTGVTAPLNTWTHVGVTFDINGTPTMNLYKNGSLGLRDESTWSGASGLEDATDTEFTVGASRSYREPYTGKVTSVRIYNRALTKKEINALYNKRNITSTNAPAIITEGFESGSFSENWTVGNATLSTTRKYSGSYSFGSWGDGSVDARWNFLGNGQAKIDEFSYYWIEDSSQTGHQVRLYDSNGDIVQRSETENPQWQLSDGNNNMDTLAFAGYNNWTLFSFEFDWAAGTYDYYLEDTIGTLETGTRDLVRSTNVSYIDFVGTNGTYCRFDEVKVTY